MRKNVILTLFLGIGFLGFIKILSKTSLYFTDAEAFEFLSYMNKKDNLIGVSNYLIWFFIICSVVITYLNKVDKNNKKEG